MLMRKLLWLQQHPWKTLAFFAVLCALLAAACVDWPARRLALRIDPSMERLLPAQDEDRRIYERARATFGDGDPLLLTVRFKQPVFSAESLAAVAAITESLQAQAGVVSVFSLATAPNLLASAEDLEVSTFTEQAAAAPASIPQLRQQLQDNPVYRSGLVSEDGLETAFALTLAGMDEREFQAAGYPHRLIQLARAASGVAEVRVTGVPVVKQATAAALQKTFTVTVPAVFLVIVVVLIASFRDLRLALAGTLTVAVAMLCTFALMRGMGYSLHLLTALTPVLVVTQGLCYAIHWLSECIKDADGPAQALSQRVLQATQHGAMPLMLNAVTTSVGFLALLSNGLPAIRQFALLSAIGMLMAMVLTLTLLPALVQLMGHGRLPCPTGPLYEKTAQKLAGFAIRQRALIIGTAVVLMLTGLLLSTNLKPSAEFVRGFPEDSAVRMDYEAINAQFAGANLLTVLVETNVADSLADPALTRRLDALAEWLRTQPEVGAVYGYPDLLKLLNRSFNDGRADAAVIPNEAAAIKQILIFGGGDQLNTLLDAQFMTAQLVVRLKVDDATTLSDFSQRVEAQLRALPPPLNAHLTGTSLLATRTVADLTSGQWKTVALTVFFIWAVLAVIFTSPRAALVALLPNLTPVAIYFGLLSITGIGLTPTTCLIASIVLGISVDDTIHYMVRFNEEARNRGSEEQAVRHALSGVLRPITLTMIALCLGFLVFTGSDMKSQIQFGWLAAATLFLSWVCDITLTPALASLVRIVTIWDLLRLDLGRSPQHTIPLLSGLSLRQARTFALLSNLEQVAPGTRLITEGDYARDIYVVVDGQLQAWVEREGERKLLSSMGRGAVMGEAGYFGQRRTANVDALTAARLLRFDSQDLERLRTRHPRIAATVFRNLNRIQAERISRMTTMLK